MQYHLLLWKIYEISTNVLDRHHTDCMQLITYCISSTNTHSGIFPYTEIQIPQFCRVRAHISGLWQTADPGVNEQLHGGCGSRRDHSGRPTDQPTTQQPLWHELPHTPGGLLTRQSAYELWTHTCSTCLPESLFYCRNTYGYTSYLWFSWSKVFYIKTWNQKNIHCAYAWVSSQNWDFINLCNRMIRTCNIAANMSDFKLIEKCSVQNEFLCKSIFCFLYIFAMQQFTYEWHYKQFYNNSIINKTTRRHIEQCFCPRLKATMYSCSKPI